jgi:hypothetical protein
MYGNERKLGWGIRQAGCSFILLFWIKCFYCQKTLLPYSVHSSVIGNSAFTNAAGSRTSEDRRISYIKERLYITYKQDFDYVESLGRDGKTSIYLFTTIDEKKIDYKVKYWIGAMSTPWGDQPLIQTRHVVNELPQAINDYVVKNSNYARYDITGISLDEVAANISSTLDVAQNLLNEYGLTYRNPDLNIILVYTGKEYETAFSYNDKSSILDYITRTVNLQ